MSSPLLAIDNLTLIKNEERLLENINLIINKAETVALVGKTASGKSLIVSSILSHFSKNKFIYSSGEILFNKNNLLSIKNKQSKIYNKKISVIPQNIADALNFSDSIEKQLYYALLISNKITRQQAVDEIVSCLEYVGIKDPKLVLSKCFYQLSSGEKYLVAVVKAILNRPELLIIDEPGSMLDLKSRIKFIKILGELKKELKFSLLLSTHNPSLVKNIVDFIYVIKKGKIIKSGKKEQIYLNKNNIYIQTLINHQFDISHSKTEINSPTLLKVNDFSLNTKTKTSFFSKKNSQILTKINFTIQKNETVGIIGEIGSGKTTLVLSILNLIKGTGDIVFKDKKINTIKSKKIDKYRQKIQVIFQDSYLSLNPTFTPEEAIKEAISAQKKFDTIDETKKIDDIIVQVGLDLSIKANIIRDLSIGQRQLIAIARVLVVDPELIILDEPIAHLDKVTQHHVIKLLKDHQQKNECSYLLISHDLSVIYAFCHKVMILNDGKIIEADSRDKIFNKPKCEKTKELISYFIRPKLLKPKINPNYSIPLTKPDLKSVGKKSTWSDALLVKDFPLDKQDN